MKFKLIFLVLLATVLSAGSCDAVVQDGLQSPGKYVDAGGQVYEVITETDVDNDSKVETAKNVVDTAAKVVGTVAATVPGAQGPGAILVGVLTIISTGLAFFAAREKKRANKSERIANDYSSSIDIARLEDDDRNAIDVGDLEKNLSQETKDHFNPTGGTVLE